MSNDHYPVTEPGAILIRDMAADDRPREKALKHGIKSLTDAELMAIIFSTGIQGKSVLTLCQEILADNDNHISKLHKLSILDITNRYKGIGKAKAISILAALELGSRSAQDALRINHPTITNAEVAYKLMRPHFVSLPHEEFWVLLMSQAGKPLREVCVSRGGIAMTAVDVKIVLKQAIECYASSMILFHNHPSGTLTPSPQDDNLTKRICTGASAIDVRVNDHIIVTDAGYYSYRDHGFFN